MKSCSLWLKKNTEHVVCVSFQFVECIGKEVNYGGIVIAYVVPEFIFSISVY